MRMAPRKGLKRLSMAVAGLGLFDVRGKLSISNGTGGKADKGQGEGEAGDETDYQGERTETGD